MYVSNFIVQFYYRLISFHIIFFSYTMYKLSEEFTVTIIILIITMILYFHIIFRDRIYYQIKIKLVNHVYFFRKSVEDDVYKRSLKISRKYWEIRIDLPHSA